MFNLSNPWVNNSQRQMLDLRVVAQKLSKLFSVDKIRKAPSFNPPGPNEFKPFSFTAVLSVLAWFILETDHASKIRQDEKSV